MASLDEIRVERERKLGLLKAAGQEVYPATVERTGDLASIVADWDHLVEIGAEVRLAGRVRAIRGQGAVVFIDLDDGSARLQGLLKSDALDGEAFNLFKDTVDLGDFIELGGSLFITERGEKTLAVADWRMLVKTLLPLPDKWHGLTDDDARFRKRYLDILMNEETRDLFVLKARFWDEVRSFLKQRGFLEVETPTLELSTGGAEANPFKTHHDDFDLDVFLRISVGELWQKRLLAAGFPKTFEIGRVYRNEGSSPEHLQEFTNIEFYAAYLSFANGKKLIQELYRTLAQNVFGRTSFEVKGHNFDLAADWEELDYVKTIEKMLGINVLEASESALKAKLTELGVTYEGENRERLADSLWKFCRKQISGPAFLVNHPKLVAPLSKEHPEDSRLTLTCQVILAGSELGRAHAELNDPADQAERFRVQQELLAGGDKEAMMPDSDFVEMLEHGMPPAFGFGFGERLFSYLAGKSIRETQIFPLVRPKDNQ
ncbi:MAG: hypothetical protein A2589_01375 [Candidatus Vogelbacteria bacterium RIFOXYD1_FULL_46_19]|uniref:Aminoacyl-transfer RNA synthetases class-II family profile domain-containing protein n=1 Tax=Candidatus Vogelbacteria bacterium RIFOXYD1_FULL_46_19 TaxID=1802439 RepID=A0A1G2QFU1_9BACT|nr:MAG: hypothetical protein A2589_01375 [Candidatus Vogelbacteria bacterium RIFOXYD1_FULL_46_19]